MFLVFNPCTYRWDDTPLIPCNTTSCFCAIRDAAGAQVAT